MVPLLSVEVLEEVVTAVGALLLPALGKTLGLQPLIDSILSWRKRRAPPSPTADLLQRLHSASSEMDSVIGELRATADERLRRVTTLESSINELVEKEKTLNDKIKGTEGISRATANALAKIFEEKLEKSERPKKRRDYALFAAGVIVSAVVGIAIEATKPVWGKVLHVQAEPTPVAEGTLQSSPPQNPTGTAQQGNPPPLKPR